MKLRNGMTVYRAHVASNGDVKMHIYKDIRLNRHGWVADNFFGVPPLVYETPQAALQSLRDRLNSAIDAKLKEHEQ